MVKEGGQASGVSSNVAPLCRLKKQVCAVSVTGEMKDGDPIAVPGVLEGVEDVIYRGIWAGYQLAEIVHCGPLK
jgi:hypothetical protein